MNSGLVKDIMFSLAITLALIVVVNVVGELLVRPRPIQFIQEVPKAPEAPEAKAPAAPALVKAAPSGVASLLIAYDPAAGKKAFRKCKACHTSKKGGKNRVGPNLWDVVGREKGAVEGYRYSDALKRKGGTWGYGDLDQFIANPRVFILGTKMSLKGIKDEAVRASLIGFLRALSDDPKALVE